MKRLSVRTILAVSADIVAIGVFLSYTELMRERLIILIVGIAILWILLIKHPLVKLYTTAQMRGLWHQDDLCSEIINRFKKSQNIKLKISRGYNLFKDPDNYFYKCLNNSTTKSEKTTMKILIAVPCIKSEHIQRRAAINKEKPVATPDQIIDYIQKGLDTVVELHKKSVESNNIIIESKYYGDKDTKWRYYIFDNNILYLAYYDNKSRGTEVEMYKIHKGNQSLCEPFHSHFKDIWVDGASIEAISYIRDYYGIKDNDLTKCSDCEHKEICAKLGEECIGQITTTDKFMLTN